MPDTAESRLEARFDAIDEHFAEQRQYIELAFGTLEKRIVSLERRMNGRFENIDRRMVALETGLNGIGQRFGAVERKLTQLVALVSRRRRSEPK